MTSLQLLLWILFAITLQLGTLLAVAFWRHWRDYMALKTGLVATGSPAWSEPPKRQAPAGPTAWAGFRPFRVTRKVIEDQAESIQSFYLESEDGLPLPSFQPGQFLTFSLDIPTATGELEPIIRCYSLSDAPHPDYYRISIKRVPAPPGSHFPPGRSSNHLHDHIEVGGLLQVTGAGRPLPPRSRRRPGRAGGGWHRHHAPAEHAQLEPRRAAGTRDSGSFMAYATAAS
jgi:hypothetical protein